MFPFKKAYLAITLVAVLFLLLIVGSIKLVIDNKRAKSHFPDSINELAEVLKDNRLTEARLSSLSNYSLYIPPSKNKKKKYPQNPNGSQIVDNSPILVPLVNSSSNNNEIASSSRGLNSLNSNFLNFKSEYNLLEDISRGDNGSVYARFPKQTRYALSSVALTIYAEKSQNPSAKTSYALALLNLAFSDYDGAISELELALSLEPNNGRMLNDLAAIYLARAYYDDTPQDIFQALELIDQAISADPSLAEAKFNRALILQRLFLYPSAKKYWQEFLALDSKSDWANEARKQITIIDTPPESAKWPAEQNNLNIAIAQDNETQAHKIISRFPHPARLYATNDLIPAWADAQYQGQTEDATSKLKIARFIGKTLMELQKDYLIHDLVSSINSILAEGNSTKLNQLVEAHRKYRDGRENYEQRNYSAAMVILEETLKLFTELNDRVGIASTNFEIARCQVFLTKYKDALARFEQTQNQIGISYPYLLGRIFWLSSLAELYERKISKALNLGQTALIWLKATSDYEGLAMINLIVAGILNQIGEKKEVCQQHYKSLAYLSNIFNQSQRSQIFVGILNHLNKTGNLRSSLYFQDEIINSSLLLEKPDRIFYTYTQQSIIYYKLGDIKLALNALINANKYRLKMPDQFSQKQYQQEISILEAEYSLKENPAKSIELFTNTINFYLNNQLNYKISYFYLSRARAYLQLKDYEKAEIDLSNCIKEIEKERSKINEEQYRMLFFESPQKAYDEMILFQILYKNNLELAFDYSEMARARVLLDILDKNKATNKLVLNEVSQPFKLKEIRNNLPNNITLIKYSLLDNKLIIWLINSDEVKMEVVDISNNKLEQLIKEFRINVEKSSSLENTTKLSESLYDILIKPIDSFLSKKINSSSKPIIPRIVIIPDKSLNTIPFAALINPITNKYFIEDYAISVAPSASVFIHCLKRDKELKTKENNSILTVGNPTFDQQEFPNLKYLDWAEKEAKEIALLYKSSKSLLNKEAQKAIFLDEAAKYSTVHFAGHALVDNKSPLYSQLVFAPPPPILINT